MPINGSSIMEGATGITVTSGTAKTYSQSGLKVVNGINVIDSSVASVTTRPSMTFKSNPAVVDSRTGKWGRETREAIATRPKVLVDGSQEFPAIRVKANFHPEMTQAEILALRLHACQMIMDGDYDAFWYTGALA